MVKIAISEEVTCKLKSARLEEICSVKTWGRALHTARPSPGKGAAVSVTRTGDAEGGRERPVMWDVGELRLGSAAAAGPHGPLKPWRTWVVLWMCRSFTPRVWSCPFQLLCGGQPAGERTETSCGTCPDEWVWVDGWLHKYKGSAYRVRDGRTPPAGGGGAPSTSSRVWRCEVRSYGAALVAQR